MAIAFDATSDGGFVNPITTSTSWNHTVTGSNPFVMVYGQTQAAGGSGLVTGVTYNGTSMTSLFGSGFLESNSGDYLWFWYLPNASTGTHSITVSVNSSKYGQFVAASYTGVATSSPIDASGTFDVGSGSSNASKTLTPTVTGDWFIGGYGFAGGGSTNPTTASGSRRLIDFSGASTAIFDQGPQTLSNATLSINPNITASWQSILGALIKPAAPASIPNTLVNIKQAVNRAATY